MSMMERGDLKISKRQVKEDLKRDSRITRSSIKNSTNFNFGEDKNPPTNT